MSRNITCGLLMIRRQRPAEVAYVAVADSRHARRGWKV